MMKKIKRFLRKDLGELLAILAVISVIGITLESYVTWTVRVMGIFCLFPFSLIALSLILLYTAFVLHKHREKERIREENRRWEEEREELRREINRRRFDQEYEERLVRQIGISMPIPTLGDIEGGARLYTRSASPPSTTFTQEWR